MLGLYLPCGGPALSSFEDHVKYLVFFLMGLVALFIGAFTFQLQELWLSALASVIVVVAVILILARFGGVTASTN